MKMNEKLILTSEVEEKMNEFQTLLPQTGMRSYFNGSNSVSGTPPPQGGPQGGPQGPGRPAHNRPAGLLGTGRASSSSLPRSPVESTS